MKRRLWQIPREESRDAPGVRVVALYSRLWYIMIDLLGRLLVVGAVVIVFIAAVIAALVKPSILAMMGKNRTSGGVICGVTLLEMITMTLALFLSFVGQARYFPLMKDHDWGLFFAVLGLAGLIHIMFAALPNARLVRTAQNRDAVKGVMTGALLAGLTPLIVMMIFLSLAVLFVS